MQCEILVGGFNLKVLFLKYTIHRDTRLGLVFFFGEGDSFECAGEEKLEVNGEI